ncbi:MAG TPA: hypothetical protein VIM39_04880 [Candidatus Limnocylindrales bacterium]
MARDPEPIFLALHMKSQPVASERVSVAASRSPRLAVVGVAASLAAVAFIMAVNVVFLLNGRIGETAFSLIPTLLIVDLSVVGGVLTIRRPGNAIGPLLLGTGLLAAVSFAAGYYAYLDNLMGGGRLPFVVPVAWIGGWIFVPAIVLMVLFLPILFPTGHLPGPRWRILAGVAIVGLSIGTLQSATAPGPLDSADWIVNPVRLPAPLLDLITAMGTISRLTAPPAYLIAVAGVVARFRAARGVERQQLKWFLFVASITAVALGISILHVGPISDAAWIVGLVAMGCLPLAIGIAILRYRLYEIDRIASRTVSYAAVTAVLVTVFTAVNLALEAALASMTQAGTLAVAASTLVVFALFQPLRRRVQAGVDHRFNRDRYEADRIVAAFAERLRDQVDPDRLRLELDRVLAQTVAPTSSYLWLRGGKETVR